MKQIRFLIPSIIFTIVSIMLVLLIYSLNYFKLIMFHDSPFPLNPLKLSFNFFYVWRDISGFGYFDPTGPPLSFFYAFISVIYYVVHNIVLTQMIFLIIVMQLTLYSAYFLARELDLNIKFSIFFAFMYLMNPYSLYYVWRILNMNILLYAVLPSFFLGLINISKGKFRKGAALLFMSYILSIPSFTNPAWYVSLFGSLILFMLTTNLLVNEFKTMIKGLTILLLLAITIFVTVYLPIFLYSYNTSSSTTLLPTIEVMERIYKIKIMNVSFLNIFSISSLSPTYEKIVWYSFRYIYRTSYLSTFVSLINASLIIFTLLRLLKSNSDANVRFYIGFLVLFLLISPIIFSNSLLPKILKGIPILLALFRYPYHKLGYIITLALLVLLSTALQRLLLRYRSLPVRTIFIILIILIFIYNSFPFFTLSFVPTKVIYGNNITVSAFTNEHVRYEQAIKYLYSDTEVANNVARVLVYPLVNVLWCDHGYWGKDILQFSGISTISSISHMMFREQKVFLYSLQDLNVLKDKRLGDVLYRLGVKYILIRKKPCEYYNRRIVNSIESLFAHREDIQKIMENKYFILYRISGSNFSRFFLTKPIRKPSDVFEIKRDYVKIMAPLKYGWNLITTNNSLAVLTPMKEAKNITYVDIIFLQINNTLIFDDVKVVVETRTRIDTSYIAFIYKDGSKSGRLFPLKVTIYNDGSLLKYDFEFRINTLSGIKLNDINHMFIGFKMNIPNSVVLDRIEFIHSNNSLSGILSLQPVQSYDKISPTHWRVRIASKEPFILVFTEGFDPLWEAKVYRNGALVERVRSVPVYGFINGFWINETGNLTIVVQYVPQDWFELGLKISVTTFALCVFYLVWDWRRCRGDRWALWLERHVRSIPRYLKAWL